MDDYKVTLRKLAVRDDHFVRTVLSEERSNAELSGIDAKSHALVRIAALIAMDAAPPSYMSAVEAGFDRARVFPFKKRSDVTVIAKREFAQSGSVIEHGVA